MANQDLNKQLSDVEDFITKKVDAIIISPVDSKGVQAAIIKADKAGIPVITVDRCGRRSGRIACCDR
ncbi:substrate-binding domain-containing protein [Escherichia coli]|uniref:substrate-binding domain-containing protein n=1 Tax=Escherichia coli TaxID=562 RepID=UPI0030EEB40C